MRPETREKVGFKASMRALGLLVVFGMRTAPALTVAALILVPFAATGILVIGVFAKHVTDAAVSGDAERVVRLGALMGAGVGLSWLLGATAMKVRLTLTEKVGHAFERRLGELMAGLPGLEHYERPDYLDRIELLRQQQWQLSMLANSMLNNLRLWGQTVLTMVLLGRLHPLLLLLPVFSLPAVVITPLTQRMHRKVEELTAEPSRLRHHLLEIGVDANAGKELRVFGLASELVDRWAAAFQTVYRPQLRVHWQANLIASMAYICTSVGFAGAIGFVAWRAINGQATPGDVVLVIALAEQASGQLWQIVGMLSWLMQNLRTAGRFIWLVDYDRRVRASVGEERPAPERLVDGIRFEGVGFQYPGTEIWALREVDLHLPAGSVVALVGDNGAGKTTLVKLLSRFYDPAEGRITVDGTELRDISHEEWRSRMAAGFQDFARVELTAVQAVGVGDLPFVDDERQVSSALERASATEVMSGLAGGLGTQLGRQWDGGVELSGGQWQKLALGRAFMRDAPVLLVLDEPTSALDADTEHALFERFAAAAKGSRERGSITVLVSHRFSTVRMADLIVVVEGGRVTATGTHEELMRAGGTYSDLYSIQARAYR